MFFEKEGIPFEVSLKKTVKDIPVLDWLIKVLRFSVNPKDKSSGIAALADKKYGDRHVGEGSGEKQLIVRETEKCR